MATPGQWAMVPVKDLKPNKKNPRVIKDDKFAKLVASIRDFPQMLELRPIVVDGDGVVITWKGPRLDATAKTRREIELPLAEGAALGAAGAVAGAAATLDRWTELLEALGFRRVREVTKRRRLATVEWQQETIEVALDHVAGLGDFVELEMLADTAGITAAAACIESLAQELGCTKPERRSYLEMLLASES